MTTLNFRYIYCDEVNITEDNVYKLLSSAKFFKLPTLDEKCMQFLEALESVAVSIQREHFKTSTQFKHQAFLFNAT